MRRKRHRTWQLILLTLSLAGLAFIIFGPGQPGLPGKLNPSGWTGDATATPAPTSSPAPSPTPSPSPSPTEPPATEPPEPEYAEAVWIGVGDIMMHKPQLPGSYDQKTARYNFDPFFAEVKPILEQGDWVIANLETPIAGKEFGYTGYPTFNAPVELAEALKHAGFNLITNANNHSLDKGEQGVLRTLEHLRELELPSVGTADSQEAADALLLTEKNGITMGLLAYTYGTNGIPIPAGKPYLVSMIDEEKIKQDIKRCRQAGADLVTVSLHFGNEYQTVPSDEQKRLARSLVAAGADIIAGSHPHVVQPYEVIETTDELGRVKQGLIIYSMGNFISNQRGDTKDYGVIFKVDIRKNMTDGFTELTEVEAIPTWVHRYKPAQAYQYRILPIEEALAAADDSLLTPADYTELKQTFKQIRERLDSMQ
jgi:poly-gamma-glutamate capsule biosynthesis protein CapA/YwtB (metallophosphatase superfamily)